MKDEININGVTYIKKEVYNNDVESKRDYSKWVGRNGNYLAIKGEHCLKSFTSDKIDIMYNDVGKSWYIDTLNYEEVTLDECKPGDVVCVKMTEDVNDLELFHFGIVNGIDNDNEVVCHYLSDSNGLEKIDNKCYVPSIKVHRFLRR